jgi:ADP-heptose:LPS heptosyltransferase
MALKKIIILKNDRTGDLFVSLKAINRILIKHKNDDISIFLSQINCKFNFLFPKIKKKIISMDLGLHEKFYLLKYLVFNKIDIVYILTPKNFYYYLPFFFRKIKFYAITIKGLTNRPNNFLLKYLHKYVVINRLTIKKRLSSYNIQESLIEYFDNSDMINSNSKIKNNFHFPKEYVFFHYKHKLFNDLLGWSLVDIDNLLEFLEKKNKNIMFSSELNNNHVNNHFLKKYNSFDFYNETKKNINERGIYFLKDVEGYDLFDIVKKSNNVVAPEGIITHMAYFLKKPILALMHFNLKNKRDFINQIISCKEWFPPSKYKFIVLKKNFAKSINKLSKRI